MEVRLFDQCWEFASYQDWYYQTQPVPKGLMSKETSGMQYSDGSERTNAGLSWYNLHKLRSQPAMQPRSGCLGDFQLLPKQCRKLLRNLFQSVASPGYSWSPDRSITYLVLQPVQISTMTRVQGCMRRVECNAEVEQPQACEAMQVSNTSRLGRIAGSPGDSGKLGVPFRP